MDKCELADDAPSAFDVAEVECWPTVNESCFVEPMDKCKLATDVPSPSGEVVGGCYSPPAVAPLSHVMQRRMST